MIVKFVNSEALRSFSKVSFESKQPFPWNSFQDFLTPDGFLRLCRSYPALELFEKHEGLARGYGQRPHNRYYLAYQQSLYHPKDYRGRGIVRQSQLSPDWQAFLGELEGKPYRSFLASILEISKFKTRYSWHMGVANSEVSPHRDSLGKAGIQLLYFNPKGNWNKSWGGEPLLLGKKITQVQNPDFSDFQETIAIPLIGNRSLFFKNSPTAWHGVKRLTCPPGKYRRLFSIIVETPENTGVRFKRILKKLLRRPIYPGAR